MVSLVIDLKNGRGWGWGAGRVCGVNGVFFMAFDRS